MNATLTMTKTFLKVFARDRQAIIFSLFFPILMMLAFGFFNSDTVDPIEIGIVNYADSPLSADFIDSVAANPLFNVTEGSDAALRDAVIAGDLALALIIPENFREGADNVQLTLLMDASRTQQVSTLLPLLEQGLVQVERDLRNLEPLFTLTVEDVEARTQTYLDFVMPGLLALALMQISIGGSGFNIVEFRRKGILKRLFVTPLHPRDFITGLVVSRLIIVLVQLTVILGFAVFLLDITFAGDLFSLYIIIILGAVIFLSVGFSLGSLAKTQQAIMALNMLVSWPQILLTGVFYPIDSMPEIVQPVAAVLPLTFVVDALRGVATEGIWVFDMIPSLVGILVWIAVAMLLAIRLFNWKEVAG